MKSDNENEGPVQSHNPDERIWEYDGDGNKIYKLSEGYSHKTSYTNLHFFGTHFWRGRG